MKKYISFFLCVVLLFGALPFQVSAAENTSTHDELIALACEAFQEYADILRNPPVAVYAHSSEDKVIFRETRDISDNHNVSIAIYQSGLSVVSDSIYDVKVTDSSGNADGSNYLGTASYRVTCPGLGGAFELSNVKYKIRRGGSGIFTSYGTYSTDKECAIGDVSRSSTSMSYCLTFNMAGAGKTHASTTFEVYFSGGAIQAETAD